MTKVELDNFANYLTRKIHQTFYKSNDGRVHCSLLSLARAVSKTPLNDHCQASQRTTLRANRVIVCEEKLESVGMMKIGNINISVGKTKL